MQTSIPRHRGALAWRQTVRRGRTTKTWSVRVRLQQRLSYIVAGAQPTHSPSSHITVSYKFVAGTQPTHCPSSHITVSYKFVAGSQPTRWPSSRLTVSYALSLAHSPRTARPFTQAPSQRARFLQAPSQQAYACSNRVATAMPLAYPVAMWFHLRCRRNWSHGAKEGHDSPLGGGRRALRARIEEESRAGA